MNTIDFKFEVIKETEKAVFAKVPYWEPTHYDKKKHKQFFFECWIPKNIIANNGCYYFVLGKIEERRLSNPYQLGNKHKGGHLGRTATPAKYKNMGQYAPEKKKVVFEVFNSEKCILLKNELMAKYGIKNYDRDFFISPIDGISDEDMLLARYLRNESMYESQLMPIVGTVKLYNWVSEGEQLTYNDFNLKAA